MGKLEDLKNKFGTNVSESIGLKTGATIPADAATLGKSARQVGVDRAKDAALISLDRITFDPDQPRKTIDPGDLDEMAASLEMYGQLQPIRVRWLPREERFMILVGERRYRAAEKIGMKSIACVIDDREMSVGMRKRLQLVENCVRADVPPIEQARTMREIMDEEGINQLELSARLSMSPAKVNKCLSMLKLPAEIQDQVERGKIPPETAYGLVKIDDPDAQVEVADRIASQKLSRAESQAIIRETAARPRAKGRGGKPAKPAAKKLPKTWVFKAPAGAMKLTVDARKGIEPAALESFLRQALAEAESLSVGRETAAA